MRPSCVSAVTPSSRPISSAILPFSRRKTVVPVNRIFPGQSPRHPLQLKSFYRSVGAVCLRERSRIDGVLDSLDDDNALGVLVAGFTVVKCPTPC
jgi:hypothetical protein